MQRELVERARSGDREAFSILAGASISRLYAVANLILRDGDRAQDAVQEALVSAWRDMRALRDLDAWDAWLNRLTVRACYRWARRERRRGVVELQLEPDDDVAGTFDFARDLVDRDDLERELGRLTIDQRAVLVLHFYLGLQLAEVAGILDVPVGTAKSRLHRGLAVLRDSMRPPSVDGLSAERTA
jgi:RNA polymerase sigma-70 factor (ECF subfamily)